MSQNNCGLPPHLEAINSLENIVVLFPVALVVDSGPKRGQEPNLLFGESEEDQRLIFLEMEARAELAKGYKCHDFHPENREPVAYRVRTLLDHGLKRWETPDRFRPEIKGYTGYWSFKGPDPQAEFCPVDGASWGDKRENEPPDTVG